jgi:hypothetical protein
MKLYNYGNFIKESKEYIDSICEKYNIVDYTINDDGTVDVDSHVVMSEYKLTKLPIKFGKVSGSVLFNNNELTTLEGSPISVGGYFSCQNNKLTNLEGAPREVGGNFHCYKNKLTSLVGSPRSVGGTFNCYHNELTSLEDISQYIGKTINCEQNNLRDVRGIKDGWRGEFLVQRNPVYQIFNLFPMNRWSEVIEYLNEYDVIKGEEISYQGLAMVFLDIGKIGDYKMI